MPKVERVSTGIKKLDKLIEGGLVKGSSTLISGGAGTGKTIFCSQFIWEGLQNGETCLYITLEETPKDIIQDVVGFGWDFEKYAKSGKLMIEYKDPFKVTDITTPLIEMISSKKVQRVVVDSTSMMGLYFQNVFEVRKQLFKLLTGIKSAGATSVVTSEIVDKDGLSRFGVEEFTTDGVMVLKSTSMGKETVKTLEVKKMRRTNIDGGTHTFDFNKNGIDLTD